MKSRTFLAIGAALLLSACASTVTEPAPAPAAAPAAATSANETGAQTAETQVIKPQTYSSTVEDGDGIICKYRNVTGSNFRRKMCGTEEEWAAIEDESRKATERIQRRNRGFEPSN